MTPDFFALPRPPRASETMTLTDSSRSITITLRAMDLLDMHRMMTLRDRMVERFVPFEFRRQPPAPGATEPVDFPPVGGESVLLSEETCEACASLVVMQPEVQFVFEQLVALAATCPKLFEELMRRAVALNRVPEGKANASTDDSSGSPSDTD